MAENPFLGVRLPPDIHQALLDRAEEMGKTRSEIAIAALSVYLHLPADNSDLTSIQQQLSDVKQRLSAVEQALSDVKQNQAIALVQPTQLARSTPRRTQQAARRAIASSADESAADGWLTLKEVAAAIGVNYHNLSTKQKRLKDEFGFDSQEFADRVVELLFRESDRAGRPQRWEFDRTIEKGKFRAIASTD